MSGAELSAEIEALRALVAETAETAAKVAATLACTEHWFNLMLLAGREGYEAGLADASPLQPQPRGQRSSATLQALPGGKTARKARPPHTGGAS
jgi:hypothetical protein